jgi:hypothetical protein
LDILPFAQRRLWPELRPVVELGFVLYGGTAVALRLGHRTSVDFDFFCSQPLDRAKMGAALPFVVKSLVLQDEPDAFTILAGGEAPEAAPVKVSFFGGIGFGRIGAPDLTDDSILWIASMDDLMATKLKVLLQRVEAKDYRDVAAMIRAGASLERGLAGAGALYGAAFQPSESLKALVYFQGGDLGGLSEEDRRCLLQAVSVVRDLPRVTIASRDLASDPPNGGRP